MQSNNELKFTAQETKKYCQTQLEKIRSEIEDAIDRALKRGFGVDQTGCLILDYLDARIERLENETLETKFDVETLNVGAVEIHPDTLVVDWDCNMGFGRCVFTYDNHTQKWNVESERMSENFVRALLNKTFETLVLT